VIYARRFHQRPFARIALVVTVFAAAAGILIGDFEHHGAGRKLREAILAELQPVTLKKLYAQALWQCQ